MLATLLPRPASIHPTTPAVAVSLLVERYLRHLSAEGVPDPLAQRLTVGCMLFDLLTLAEAPVPAVVAELMGAPAIY